MLGSSAERAACCSAAPTVSEASFRILFRAGHLHAAAERTDPAKHGRCELHSRARALFGAPGSADGRIHQRGE
eukprot:14046277-Alexandrium_andersonii.AAC.1